MTDRKIQLADQELERRYLGDVLHASQRELQTHFAQPDSVAAVDLANLMHGRILGAAHELSRGGVEVSPLTVRAELERRSATGAIEVLDAMQAEYNPQGESLGVMSDRLRLLAQARRIREHAQRAAEAAGELRLDAAQEHAREVLGEQDRARVKLLSLHDSALTAVDNARKAVAGALIRRIPMGYPLLDQALKGGLRPATMAIIGGRTGAGKSSLMLGSAILQASVHGVRVGIVSCEDSADIWGERALGHFSALPTDQLLGQQLALGGASDLDNALDALACLQRVGVQLSYPLNRPLPDVLAAVRALIADGCKVIYVDYVQAILLGRGADRKDLVREATQRLKAECQQHGVALVLGSQLSRADKRDRFGEPHESDLKETGDLENMTEVVILLWKSSDAEDATALGKVTKVKWSPRRPRFELQRDDITGVLRNLLHVEPKSSGNGHGNEPEQTRGTWQ
jgi:replicative DNA helicase